MVKLPFTNRTEAGRLLGAELARRKLPGHVIVLALPRGGVPVGFEVAKILHAPLDVVVVRKIGVPFEPELAMGAIAGTSVEVLDQRLIDEFRISQKQIEAVLAKERAEVERREKLYRGGRPALDLHGHTALLVDDGLATGSTMVAAARYVRALKPAKTIIAVPVGSIDACERLRQEADELVCLATPKSFFAVGEWFVHFPQLDDKQVQSLLEESRLSAASR
jgi:putative phosphoribosyl transferase